MSCQKLENINLVTISNTEIKFVKNDNFQKLRYWKILLPQRRTRILKKLSLAWVHNKSNLGITKHRKFVGFLNQTGSALREGDLPASFVLDPLHFNLPSPHFYLQKIGLFLVQLYKSGNRDNLFLISSFSRLLQEKQQQSSL